MTWGHPVTSGLRHMDYFVSSAELEPEEGDDEYTEAVVRLPHHPVRFKKVPARPFPPPIMWTNHPRLSESAVRGGSRRCRPRSRRRLVASISA